MSNLINKVVIFALLFVAPSLSDSSLDDIDVHPISVRSKAKPLPLPALFKNIDQLDKMLTDSFHSSSVYGRPRFGKRSELYQDGKSLAELVNELKENIQLLNLLRSENYRCTCVCNLFDFWEIKKLF
ncbi:hypothetical protein HELRODRAFT_179309 [Helobdella robusta]|uniref:Uncharacterized protein n=1 Tax=Helobdella robusta TaxID=6412 RepID=T1FEI9_HELRO|nr:hypothetical protein HELRODRAFT_179309 [Helobdella robusta]ESN95534.1 hypothetical protein HELRODRAFT_179309 [Helobdella robusta]